MQSSFTILGAQGFIGSRLADALVAQRYPVFRPGKEDGAIFAAPLGHVIYCIGLTADFRTRPFDTIQAHVSLLAELLRRGQFESLLYLSSARVYSSASSTAEESSLSVNPADPGDLYNLSKLLGESLCLTNTRPHRPIRAVRLTNVYGDDLESENFLTSVLRDAVERQEVVFQTALDSAKDYISVQDVVSLLPQIALWGKAHLYNLGSGRNTTHQEIADQVAALTGCQIKVMPGARRQSFPTIDMKRTQSEFPFTPRSLSADLKTILEHYEKKAA